MWFEKQPEAKWRKLFGDIRRVTQRLLGSFQWPIRSSGKKTSAIDQNFHRNDPVRDLPATHQKVELVWTAVTETVSISAYRADDGTSISLAIEALASDQYEWTVHHPGAAHLSRAGVAPSLAAAVAAATAAASSLH
jgi:hypothetical protein